MRRINVERWNRTTRSRKVVVTGFGSSGNLHLGHLALICQYKALRKRCKSGLVFVSDVGAFFSHKSLGWDEVIKFRNKILNDLSEMGLKEDTIVESEHLSELLDTLKNPDYSRYNLGHILTFSEIKMAAERFPSSLTILSRDETGYTKIVDLLGVSKERFSYWIYDDLKSPISNKKMSKSVSGTSIYISDAIAGKYKISKEYLDYLKGYFDSILKGLVTPKKRSQLKKAEDLKDMVLCIKEMVK